MNHIDLHDKYALLEDGTTEDLWWNFDDGTKEPKDCYEGNGGYYLIHDRIVNFYDKEKGECLIKPIIIHSKIIATSNNLSELYI